MSFQASDIGTNYDVGLATRPNLDGSTATLNCLNEDGAQVALSQVAFMFLADDEQEEAADLLRKDQLIRLSSANVIDREFTMYPQVTQGDWRGGEAQRIFTDPRSYYKGEGLIWPSDGSSPGGFSPTRPLVQASVTQINQSAGPVTTGMIANFGVSLVAAKTVGGVWQIQVVRNDSTSLGFNLTNNSIPTAIAVANGVIYYAQAGVAGITSASYNGAVWTQTAAALAYPVNGPLLVNGGLAGPNSVLLVFHPTSAGAVLRIFFLPAATFTDVIVSAVAVVQSATLLGGAVYFVASDLAGITIETFDLTALQTSTLSILPGYVAGFVQAASGAIFLLATTYNPYDSSNLLRGGAVSAAVMADCFLLIGSQLQYIAGIPPLLTSAPPTLATQTLSATGTQMTAFGPYVFFVIGYGSTGPGGPALFSALMAYDVVRGSIWTASQNGQGTGALSVLPTPTGAFFSGAGVSAQFAIIQQGGFVPTGGGQQAGLWQSFFWGIGNPILAQGGRVFSSVIDFTSASIKLYRQIVITHEPITQTGGQTATMSVYAWLDTDVDNLPADTPYKLTNNIIGSTQTILLINKMAKKLIYMIDWINAPNFPGVIQSPHPISVAIQAATGWVKTLQLALSDSAMTNGQNPQETCFQQQDNQLDALAARNFVRQLWRQKGGQCIVTYDDGDSYNAVLQEFSNKAKKFKSMDQPGDRKVRYEGRLTIKIAEDL